MKSEYLIWDEKWFTVVPILNGKARAIIEKGHPEVVCCYEFFNPDGSSTLIDTGMGLSDLKTALVNPHKIKRVILTHTHNDHVGGLESLEGDFEVIVLNNAWGLANLRNGQRPTQNKIGKNEYAALNPGDFDSDYDLHGDVSKLEIKSYKGRIRVVEEGELLECGSFNFMVIASPGHTEDGIMLWDEANGVLVMGDMGYDGMLFEHLDECNIEDFYNSIDKVFNITGLGQKISFILPGHNEAIHMGPDLLKRIHFLISVVMEDIKKPIIPFSHPQITKSIGIDEFNPYTEYKYGRLGIRIKREDPLPRAA